MSCRIDLHVHSPASPCSVLGPGDLAAEARARGLDGVAVVDHDRFPDPSFLREAARGGLRVYQGVELATPDGDLLLFGLAEPPPAGLSGTEAVAWVLARGGAAVAAHPFRRGRPASPALLALPGLPLEGLNGRCSEEENRRTALACLEGHRPATGGSDAHEPGEVGAAATRFDLLPADEADLARLLLAGRCAPWAPARPFVRCAGPAVPLAATG